MHKSLIILPNLIRYMLPLSLSPPPLHLFADIIACLCIRKRINLMKFKSNESTLSQRSNQINE